MEEIMNKLEELGNFVSGEIFSEEDINTALFMWNDICNLIVEKDLTEKEEIGVKLEEIADKCNHDIFGVFLIGAFLIGIAIENGGHAI